MKQFLIVFLSAFTVSAHAWEYKENIDQMRGTKTKFAEITSNNSVNFAFPYNGGSTLDLIIRKRKQDGLNVFLRISKGQFSCFTDCNFYAKFDNGKVERLAATGAENGSSDVIFVQGESNFVAKIKKSKQLIIESQFYNTGGKQFQFDVTDLKWD